MGNTSSDGISFKLSIMKAGLQCMGCRSYKGTFLMRAGAYAKYCSGDVSETKWQHNSDSYNLRVMFSDAASLAKGDRSLLQTREQTSCFNE